MTVLRNIQLRRSITKSSAASCKGRNVKLSHYKPGKALRAPVV
jgi:hypothetical protein